MRRISIPFAARFVAAACLGCQGFDPDVSPLDPASGAAGNAGTTGAGSGATGSPAGSAGSRADAGIGFAWHPPAPSSDMPATAPPLDDSTEGAAATCASTSATAERLPVDLFLLVDASGSMLSTARDRRTKWVAMKEALARFLASPATASLNVGMTLFPAAPPIACDNDAACGAFGACLPPPRYCVRSGPDGVMTFAALCSQANATCPAGSTCRDLGRCISGGVTTCYNIGGPCTTGTAMGTCVRGGRCGDTDACNVAHYNPPTVPIAALGTAAPAILKALDARTPTGGTPTGAALNGTYAYARKHAASHPERKTVVVLATDGLPTACPPFDIPTITTSVSNARVIAPSIPTYVIGVFTPAEQARADANLTMLATAGGSPKAFIINTDQDVSASLATALDEIRSSALACEYDVPKLAVNDGKTKLDFSKVNVAYAGPDGKSTLVGYVPGREQCDAARGGWHYDADPDKGGTPARIMVCPKTCDQLKSLDRAKIEIKLGCKTEFLIF